MYLYFFCEYVHLNPSLSLSTEGFSFLPYRWGPFFFILRHQREKAKKKEQQEQFFISIKKGKMKIAEFWKSKRNPHRKFDIDWTMRFQSDCVHVCSRRNLLTGVGGRLMADGREKIQMNLSEILLAHCEASHVKVWFFTERKFLIH